jgi:cell division protein FtsB
MKDSKTLLLLVVSLLLLLASITLLWSWGYQFSFSHKQDTAPQTVPVKTNTRSEAEITDSLQKIYYATLDHLDKTIDSVYNHTDSLKGNLDEKLTDFYQTRKQITDLFKNKVSDADITVANQRILQLQQRISQLRSSNTDVENENRRLNTLLRQYLEDHKKSEPVSTAPLLVSAPTTPNVVSQNNIPPEIKPTKIEAPETQTSFNISAGDLQLTAITNYDGKETLKAESADKITGAFTIKNNTGQTSNIDLMVVVLQPDGKTMQKSTWESGSFETSSGKRIYSCKIPTQCALGETKKLHFWLAAEKYQKGNYTLLLYQNGIMIGRTTKQLS